MLPFLSVLHAVFCGIPLFSCPVLSRDGFVSSRARPLAPVLAAADAWYLGSGTPLEVRQCDSNDNSNNDDSNTVPTLYQFGFVSSVAGVSLLATLVSNSLPQFLHNRSSPGSRILLVPPATINWQALRTIPVFFCTYMGAL